MKQRLFEPGNVSLRRDYPILNEYEEFKALNDRELLFVWYYSCKDSPIFGYKDRDRLTESFERVGKEFTDNMKTEVYESYVDLRFPPHVTEAMRVMSSFEPEVRAMAKTFTDRFLNYANHVTSKNIADYEEASDLKAFMEMQINLAKNMPSVVAAAENGYGYVRKKDTKEDKKAISPFEEE